MPARTTRPEVRDVRHLGDFTATPRMLQMTALAMPIGAAAACAAWVLQRLIGLITNAVFHQQLSWALRAPGQDAHWWVLLAAPPVGGLIVGVMARYGSEKIRGHGMPETIEAVLLGGSKVEPRVAVLKPVSAAVSIGTGGPFGAEGPIIMTGGAMGSLLAQFLHLTADERKSLLVAGSAAGMAATFDAPLASILLAAELLLFEWRPRSLVPVAAAVSVATVLRGPLLGSGHLFAAAGHLTVRPVDDLLAVVSGVIAAGLAVVATTLVYLSEDLFHRLPIHWMWWPAIGGLVIGVGGLIEPRALGVGYDVIDQLLTGRAGMSLVVGILVVKTLIWSLSLGSGTSGGVLAPVFMIGGALGAVESHVLPSVFPGFWAMMGLAAVVGGVMRSPLTGVVFPLELTHAWPAMMPLLIAATTAYLLSTLVLKRSVLTEKIARRGLHLTREYSIDPLDAFFASEVMETAPVTLALDSPALDIAPDQHLYPVVTAEGELLGAVTGGQLRDIPADAPKTVADVLIGDPVTVYDDDTLRQVANVFAANGVTRAPVIERAEHGRLVGIVSLTALLHARLHDLTEERHRERQIPLRYLPHRRRGAAEEAART